MNRERETKRDRRDRVKEVGERERERKTEIKREGNRYRKLARWRETVRESKL